MTSERRAIVITGCSGGGKSTLLAELARRGYQTVSEPGRDIVRAQLATGGDALPWENTQLFAELCISRSIEAFETTQGLAFFDRTFLDNVSGMQTLDGQNPRHLQLVDEYRHANPVFFAPPWPEIFEQDDERRHGWDVALAECRDLEAFYKAAGYELVHLPKITVSERADFIEERLGLRHV